MATYPTYHAQAAALSYANGDLRMVAPLEHAISAKPASHPTNSSPTAPPHAMPTNLHASDNFSSPVLVPQLQIHDISASSGRMPWTMANLRPCATTLVPVLPLSCRSPLATCRSLPALPALPTYQSPQFSGISTQQYNGRHGVTTASPDPTPRTTNFAPSAVAFASTTGACPLPPVPHHANL